MWDWGLKNSCWDHIIQISTYEFSVRYMFSLLWKVKSFVESFTSYGQILAFEEQLFMSNMDFYIWYWPGTNLLYFLTLQHSALLLLNSYFLSAVLLVVPPICMYLPAVLLVCCTSCCPTYLHALLPAVLLVCCTSCCPAYLPVLLLAVLLACGISCRPTFLSFYLLIFLLHACLLYFLSCLSAFLSVTTFSAVLCVHVLHYVQTQSLKCTLRPCNTI